MTIIHRDNSGHLSVAEAKRLILSAVPSETAVDVFVSLDSTGQPDWENVEMRVNENETIQGAFLGQDFLAACAERGIHPRLKYRPMVKGYRGDAAQDDSYMLTHGEFALIAEAFGFQVALREAPLTPPPDSARDAARSASEAQTWTVRKPERFTPYSAPLFRFLSAAHREGQPRPTARDVIEAWRVNPPSEVAKVMADSIDYYDSNGDTKAADLEALRKAIGRMTSAR